MLALIGIGPGDVTQITVAAQQALQAANVVIGYKVYIEIVRPLLHDTQEIVLSPMGSEMKRARQAIDLALSGRDVALISSGDIGIYAMASPAFEQLETMETSLDVVVYPGVSAMQAVAARVGAPLSHDFCAVSLSDLLTPWEIIARRIEAAAWGDFVVAFYNPRSHKRHWQLSYALEVLRQHRPADTPTIIARQITRPDEHVIHTTLAELDPAQVDMFTLVLVGNSQSRYVNGQWMMTPRGYHTKGQPPSPSTPEPPAPVYPITLANMQGAGAVVVGGGPVAQRKVAGLLNAEAAVRLISPDATPQLTAWATAGRLTWERRAYQPGDLVGARLAFAATNQRQVNAQVAAEAHAAGILCNIADNPAEGDFHVPAVYRQPGLVVAVSTAGNSPTRARQIRDKIKQLL